MVVINHLPGSMRVRPAGPRAFTIMELMVAVSILVVIILGVGVTFNGASKSVGVSQATMDLMTNVRATQKLIDSDVAGMDKNCFLVIRQRLNNPTASTTSLPALNGRSLLDITPHYDQIAFISRGSFPNRTGAYSGGLVTFSDGVVANAAHVWWGQLIVEKNGANQNPNVGPFLSYAAADQSKPNNQGQAQLPTGVYSSTIFPLPVTHESDFVLGRHLALLMPSVPIGVPAYATLAYSATNAFSGLPNESAPHIASSRLDVVAQSPSQLMQSIAMLRAANNAVIPEYDLYTYRFRALASVYDSEQASFTNGYFRTTPEVMKGVSSFKIEWTDGQTYPNGSLVGQFVWYGFNNTYGGTHNIQAPVMEPVIPSGGNANGDNYVAVFSYFNKTSWPKALRFSYHIASDRLSGGRDFVQVVKLPD